MSDRVLAPVIVVLAIADGILHLSLDVVLFRGRFFANQLSILFLLNFVGYIVLAGVFLFRERLFGSRAWVANLLLGLYALATIVMWAQRHGPNPLNLGYTSKVLEVLLIVAVAAHWWLTQRSLPRASRPQSA